MSLYKITIQTDSKAFKGEPGMKAMEVSRILEELADQMNRTAALDNRHLFDARGLRCGSTEVVNGETE